MFKSEDQNFKEWLEVVDAVYLYRGFSKEAICLHGWTDLFRETAALVGKLYKEAGTPVVLLNGLEKYGGGDVPGFTHFKELLCRHGVPENRIVAVTPAKQTFDEAHAFMEYAKIHGLSSVTIVSVPQHLLRAFLTNLGVMQEKGMKLHLHPRTLEEEAYRFLDTYELVPLLRDEPERATRLGRFAAECVRILLYRAKLQAGDKSYQLASIGDAHRYIHDHWKGGK